jgi:CheY-like chemotaxis protein
VINQPIKKTTEILLVESDPEYTRIAENILSVHDGEITMTVFDEGADALKFLVTNGRSYRPDLILFDLPDPGESSHHILRSLKEDESLKKIPVIVFTGEASEKQIYELFGLHANCCITKPENIECYTSILRAIKRFWLTIVKLPEE